MEHKFERYCKDYENIENYHKAKADNFKGWRCHHRLETHTSDGKRREVDILAAELRTLGMYYNRPADELIFLTTKEHRQLHTKGKHLSEEHKKKISEGNRGKQLTEETKHKMSLAKKGENHPMYGKKGENNPMYGKRHSAESIQKISDALKGKTFSQEHRNKIGEARKGMHWYNNGKENKYCFECPPGFTTGRLFTNIYKGN